jgi:PKD repeat protein
MNLLSSRNKWGCYNYADWGDGNITTAHTEMLHIIYITAGTYQVTITGAFPRIDFSTSSAVTIIEKLFLSIIGVVTHG